jgi:hypothetical protein
MPLTLMAYKVLLPSLPSGSVYEVNNDLNVPMCQLWKG